jgi:hypothetical protein
VSAAEVDPWDADDVGTVPWTAADERDLAAAERAPALAPAAAAGVPNRAVSLANLAAHRRELVELSAAARAIGTYGLPMPAELAARVRALRSGSVTVWVPCAVCRQLWPDPVAILPRSVAERSGSDPLPDWRQWYGVPLACLCEPCNTRTGGAPPG